MMHIVNFTWSTVIVILYAMLVLSFGAASAAIRLIRFVMFRFDSSGDRIASNGLSCFQLHFWIGNICHCCTSRLHVSVIIQRLCRTRFKSFLGANKVAKSHIVQLGVVIKLCAGWGVWRGIKGVGSGEGGIVMALIALLRRGRPHLLAISLSLSFFTACFSLSIYLYCSLAL